MQVVRSLDEASWRCFIDKHPASSVFHTPEMFQVFALAKDHQPTMWAAANSHNDMLAILLPVQITLRDGLLRLLTTRSVAYSSVLYAPGPAGEEALATLLHTYTQETDRAVLFTELRNLSDLSPVQPVLNERGFVYEDHLDYLVNLDRPVKEVMQGISKRTRKKIRHGLRSGEVIIEEIVAREQIPLCYDLLRQTYAAVEVPLADPSMFEAAFDVLYPLGMIKFFLARVGEANVAATVELLYKDVMYGWYGGVDRAYARYNPGELLTWHVLKWGAENGYKVYDFGGAGKPDEEYGVRDFKAKFGGELVCYGRNTYVHAPTRFAISKMGYQIYRRLNGFSSANIRKG